jgi:hypothetical protein
VSLDPAGNARRSNTAFLVGAGAVGARTARQLIETAGIERLLIADRDRSKAEQVAQAIGASATPIIWRAGDALPDGIAVVAGAVPSDVSARIVDRAIEARVPVALSVDDADAIDDIRERALAAQNAGTPVLIGCGLAPGLSDVLVRHAQGALDVVDDISVARVGAAGSASLAAVRRARRERAVELRGGELRDAKRAAEELVWFPDPIGGQACAVVAAGVTLLHEAFPTAKQASVRFAEPIRTRRWQRQDPAGPWGATRVEVWGSKDGRREGVVYGVVERTATAAGAVLALAAAGLAGRGDWLEPVAPGVYGLGAVARPVPFLAELARRGVRAAVFEGTGRV